MIVIYVAVKDVRREHNVNVDMRIGVHTGFILSGIIGNKREGARQIDRKQSEATMGHDGGTGNCSFVH